MTAALKALSTALEDVDNLLAHHPNTATPKRGRPPSQEGPLIRSCVLLTYAAWEVYVEDSVIWSVEQLVSVADPGLLPSALRGFVSGGTSDPWSLAGDAWRGATTKAVTLLVRGSDEDETTFGMNSAGPRQINKLHDDVLGVRLLDKCRWKNKSNDAVKSELASLVRVRGSIAHTGKPPGTLHLGGARAWRTFAQRLAEHLDGHVEQWTAHQLRATGGP